jgi:hypothetical protein
MGFHYHAPWGIVSAWRSLVRFQMTSDAIFAPLAVHKYRRIAGS